MPLQIAIRRPHISFSRTPIFGAIAAIVIIPQPRRP